MTGIENIAIFLAWFYCGGSKIGARKDPFVKHTIIKGNGYIKHLFHDLGLEGNQEFSVFFWDPGAQSLPHDHNVDEITEVLVGRIYEIRKVGEEYSKTYVRTGERLNVPAGTEHIVGVEKTDMVAITVNWCDGRLSMNILEQFQLFTSV